MAEQLPSWPTTPPAHGRVVLRAFTDDDAHLAVELGSDPYVPLIGSLPAFPTAQQALEWIRRQRGRLAEGAGLSFVIADAESGTAVGAIGLWLQNLPAGRATAGYAVAPAHRGRGRGTPARSASRKRRDTGGRACCAVIRRSAAPGATCCSTRRRGHDRAGAG